MVGNILTRNFARATFLGTSLSMALLLASATATAQQGNMATPTAQQNDNDTTIGEMNHLDNFLDSHQQIAKELEKNSVLANDPTYLQSHPELAKFLKDNPGAKEEMTENPKQFMANEERYEKTGGNIKRWQLRNFDAFLDSHKEIAGDLQKNPSLAGDQTYLVKHPELKQFLDKHPNIRQELKENPKVFMSRSADYEKNEPNSKK